MFHYFILSRASMEVAGFGVTGLVGGPHIALRSRVAGCGWAGAEPGGPPRRKQVRD